MRDVTDTLALQLGVTEEEKKQLLLPSKNHL
jgi:hypothetical protein